MDFACMMLQEHDWLSLVDIIHTKGSIAGASKQHDTCLTNLLRCQEALHIRLAIRSAVASSFHLSSSSSRSCTYLTNLEPTIE